jgi:hypothetical protein
MPYDDDGSADIASREGAKALEQARQRCTEALYLLAAEVQGDPQVAPLGAEMDPSNPMPEIHASILLYWRQLRPHLLHRAEPHWTGDHYDEPIAVVKIPVGPAIEHMDVGGQMTTEVIEGLSDVSDWTMKSVDRGTETTQCYLSPAAATAVHDKLFEVQSGLGLYVEGDQVRDSRRSGDVSKI